MGKRLKPNTLPEEVIRASSDGTLTVLAMQAFDVFHTFMRDNFREPWPTATYEKNRFWKTGFMAIARLCFMEKWDVDEFIRSTLPLVHKNHNYVVPSHLVADNVLTQYRENLNGSGPDHIKNTPDATWTMLVSAVIDYITTAHSSEREVLLSPVTPFPAWFRLVYPEQMDPDILKWYGTEGCQEIENNTGLLRFLRQQTPRAIRVLAIEMGLSNTEAIP
jgi:hypothetical protein